MNKAKDLMFRYAEETGLISNQVSNRYLWTDAFAVCNFIGLYQDSSEKRYLELSKKLIDEVHLTLGKYREDDTSRSGWIGSADRPTKHGLRIGKKLPERPKGQPINQREEWSRDGQYFHYLTKWIHALIRMYTSTNVVKYREWAEDLAHASMRFIDNGHMYWKMSIDLDRPLVQSMGQHDPLDGYVTMLELKHVKEDFSQSHIKTFHKISQQVNLQTTDPLGLGGFLFDIFRLHTTDKNQLLQKKLIKATSFGLNRLHLNHQLAFRELGLAIGMYTAKQLNILEKHHNFYEKITNYWKTKTDWSEHRDINSVMLATSLEPDGYLAI